MKALNAINFDFVKRPIIYGLGIGIILISVVWWFFWMSPEGAKLTTVQTQQSTLRTQLAGLQAEISTLVQEEGDANRDAGYLHAFSTEIPPAPLQGVLVEQLYDLSLLTHTVIPAITGVNNLTPVAGGGYTTFAVDLTVNGTQANVYQFVADLYSAKYVTRLLTIQTLALTPGATASGSGTVNINTVSSKNLYAVTLACTAYTTYVPAAQAA
jgi:Tfp pilus assembly protein PilO